MADDPIKPKPLWPQWTLLVVFAFLAFESTLLAVALKGSWFILLAPGMVCGIKAIDTWRALRKQLFADAEADSGGDGDRA